MTDDTSNQNLYTVEEGTLKKDAYLNQYYHKFWAPLMDEFSDVYSEDDAIRFYENHRDEFVTEYAASNPSEDFAESFAYFISDDKPTDGSVKSQKILFFYQYPELVAMRDQIRATLNK